MGSYGIGTGRLLACVAEQHHDDHGLIWPISVAPYPVHLVCLPSKTAAQEITAAAEALYTELQAAGIEALMDDRAESAGVKFNDADLIGLPLRLTVSERSLKAGGYEFKRRDQEERSLVAAGEVVAFIQAQIAGLQAALQGQVVPVPYQE
jgi:prolyl-tRNA synthetase